jgi:hypothetical protein
MENEMLEQDSKIEMPRENRELPKEEGKYVYCVIRCNEKKSFDNIGINNGEVYTVPYKDVAAVVSDSAMEDYELTEDNIRNHEKVIRQVMEGHTIVPAEFGTVIKNETILKRLLSKAYLPTRECLNLVDNMIELGVKAVLNQDAISLDPKNRKLYASDILETLKAQAKQAIKGDLFNERLILNASFLVKREGITAFSNEVERLREKYSTLRFLYSGPWPPHNFVYIKIGSEGVEIKKIGERDAVFNR